jgi:hypothetical protein
MIEPTGSKPIPDLIFLTRKVSHTMKRPLSKALETCSSVLVTFLNGLPPYLVDTTTHFNESDRR